MRYHRMFVKPVDSQAEALEEQLCRLGRDYLMVKNASGDVLQPLPLHEGVGVEAKMRLSRWYMVEVIEQPQVSQAQSSAETFPVLRYRLAQLPALAGMAGEHSELDQSVERTQTARCMLPARGKQQAISSILPHG